MNLSEFPENALTPSEEATAATIKDEELLQQLVMHSMREAFAYAYRFANGNLDDREVLSACYKALTDAARNFQPNRIRFFAFAKPYVRGVIFSEFRARKVVKNGDIISLDGASTEKLPTESGPNDAEEMEHIKEELCVSPEVGGIMDRDELESLKPLMQRTLNPKERMILELRYEGGLTFAQIGELLGVSRSNIQHEHQMALLKVRNRLINRNRYFGH